MMALRPRIISLLSSATEILYALDVQDLLAGVSHECDYPPAALQKPRVTVSHIDATLSSTANLHETWKVSKLVQWSRMEQKHVRQGGGQRGVEAVGAREVAGVPVGDV